MTHIPALSLASFIPETLESMEEVRIKYTLLEEEAEVVDTHS
jgi:hypothetical protein